MEKDYNGYPPYMDFMPNSGIDYNEMYKDPMFNPITQYEQAYTYYKYLCMQMDYRIKCKEYDKLCEKSNEKTTEKKPI